LLAAEAGSTSTKWDLSNITYWAVDYREKDPITFVLTVQETALHTMQINFPSGSNRAGHVLATNDLPS
jgi:hypothetical protein